MADTVGTLIDALSAIELRRWKLQALLEDDHVSSPQRERCRSELVELDDHRTRLVQRLNTLWRQLLDARE